MSSPGMDRTVWATSVASGVYFYKINAGDNYENMKKMVLLR